MRYAYTALIVVVLIAVVVSGCGDGGAAELEAQAADYEAQIADYEVEIADYEVEIADYEVEIAELERRLTDATSTSTTNTPPVQTITGTMTVISFSGFRVRDGACSGLGDYEDMQAGADVVVRDGDGKIVGSSALQEGSPEGIAVCVFAFEVDVPDNVDFYTVEISHRGGLTSSYAEMEAADWIVDFDL